MKTTFLGRSDLKVTRLAYGCMRIAGSWHPDKSNADPTPSGIACVEAAFDAGYNFFDHADIYGDTRCETIFGKAMAIHPDWREKIVVATKCGIQWQDRPKQGDPHRWDCSYNHIISSTESSLKRLQLDRIDLMQLHRPDFLANPEEIARAFTQLKEQGKVREFGVSNFRPTLVSAIQKSLSFPLQVNQIEVHLGKLDFFEDGTIDQCLELKMSPLAWSPLNKGKLATGFKPEPTDVNFQKQTRLLEVLDAVAVEYQTERTAVALAWLMTHPSNIIPIVGSANPQNIKAAAKAGDLTLDRESWYKILIAARGERLP
jgi:predicted oxidoreductase